MKKVLLSALVLVAAIGGVAQASDVFMTGDVMASTSGGRYEQWRKVAGTWTKIDTLNNSGSGYTTGSAFDSTGNFYGTNFSNGRIEKFLGAGTPHTGSTLSSGYSSPESIVFSGAGDMYVGSVGGGIRRVDKNTGAVLDTFISGTRVDWMDLAADGKTMYFSQEGRAIKRVDLSTNTILSDFAALAGTGEAFALRILADGGVLVADDQNIKRLDATGATIQTYDVSGVNEWFALNLDSDGTSFWTGSFSNGTLYKFDIATGTLLDSFNTLAGGSALYGVSIFGEVTVSTVVPLPSAAWLGLAMLAGLGVFQARKRRVELA